MANSELYDKTFVVPSNVINYVRMMQNSLPRGKDNERANNIVNKGVLTYQVLKRIKHDMENGASREEYALWGGNLMKNFIDTTLNRERDAVNRSKEVTRDFHVDPSLGTKPFQSPNLNENKKILYKNALAIIVNEDHKILLVKRTESMEWQPSKWSLIGGVIEKGETPEKACKREVKEETDLDIEEFIKTFTVQRNPESIEHVFACKYKGDDTDVTLNKKENTNYGWYDVAEMEFLDTVPNLVDYIQLAFKEYD